MDHEAALIGQRVREIRAWRKMSVTVTAELAGITKGYLSLIERGQRAVTKRTTLEALAQALRVSPTDLLGKPYAPHDAASDEAHAGIPELTAVLSGWRVGEIPDVKVREWGAIQADVDQLNAVLRANADYAAQSRLVPALTKELLAAVNTSHRVKALIGLMCTYKAAAYLAHDLGVQGLPTLAAERMRQVAEELDDPVWLSYAAYQRAQVVSGNNRPRQYELAAAVADMPGARVETRGLANLTAALAAATTGRHDLAHTHLAEAANLAETIEADVSPWMNTNFGRENTNIWKVSVGPGTRRWREGRGTRFADAPDQCLQEPAGAVLDRLRTCPADRQAAQRTRSGGDPARRTDRPAEGAEQRFRARGRGGPADHGAT
nr:hypothetical protein GCM10020241_11380 [Streptoalloteichus tenebrarius]